MKIQDIMTREVCRLQPGATLNEALALMWTRDVGALVVVNPQGGCVGVLTDRDAAMAVFLERKLPTHIRVGEVMSRQIWSCAPDDSIHEAAESMRRYGVWRLLVLDDDQNLVGLVTLADLARATPAGLVPSAAGHLVRTLEAIAAPRLRSQPPRSLLDKLSGG